MKLRGIILLLFFFGGIKNGFAQRTNNGLVVRAGTSAFRFSSPEYISDGGAAFTVGIGYEFAISKRIGMEVGGNYLNTNTPLANNLSRDLTLNFNLEVWEFPLLFKPYFINLHEFPISVCAVLGPYYSFFGGTRGSVEKPSSYTGLEPKVNFKHIRSSDFGITAGLEVSLGGKYAMMSRYSWGFGNYKEDPFFLQDGVQTELTGRTVLITVGFKGLL